MVGVGDTTIVIHGLAGLSFFMVGYNFIGGALHVAALCRGEWLVVAVLWSHWPALRRCAADGVPAWCGPRREVTPPPRRKSGSRMSPPAR